MIAQLATGALALFQEHRYLDASDIHLATKLAWLAGEKRELPILLAAFTSKALQSGSACLDLGILREQIEAVSEDAVPLADEAWPTAEEALAAVEDSPLVVSQPHPLHLEGRLLYFERYWLVEREVHDRLKALLQPRGCEPGGANLDSIAAALAEIFGTDYEPQQRQAAALAALSRLTVVTGGPGSGKTYTIARVLATLLAAEPELRVALAAPTGKAAARVKESLVAAASSLPARHFERIESLEAKTIHRLLGSKFGRFDNNASHPLPYDMVVIDEASMVALPLMAALLEALPPNGSLVLVGDPDQLTPVEAGAVLADIVELPLEIPGLEPALEKLSLEPSGALVHLPGNHRSGGTRIDEAARAVQLFDAAGLEAALGDDVILLEPGADALAELQARVLESALPMLQAGEAGDVDAALAALKRHQLLCAHREGPAGVAWWVRQVHTWIASVHRFNPSGFYPGEPLLYTVNSPDLGLFNGDTGVVVDMGGELMACFPGREPLSVHLLSEVVNAFAMTVHKAQGSQFSGVTLILPPAGSPLLTHELLYTALTRAESSVVMYGERESLLKAATTKAVRASGLGAKPKV
ncbi:MAG: exodeoxyribonuclease V subunit alpha [Propionibacteriaceae bacterium]|jgi:exodeoxyribonuclease V alpha subunit|nr:exodeoxyribonuclease V subunit alpha [Propionibacteriaceae bacterium]